MVKKIRIVGMSGGKKLYQCDDREAYVDGDLKNGYSVIVSKHNKIARVLSTTYKTKNAAIKAAKTFVRKR